MMLVWGAMGNRNAIKKNDKIMAIGTCLGEQRIVWTHTGIGRTLCHRSAADTMWMGFYRIWKPWQCDI